MVPWPRGGDLLHSPAPPQAVSVGSGLTAAALPGAEFLLSRHHLQWLFTPAQGLAALPFHPTLHKWRLLSTMDIQEEEKGRPRRWSFPFLTHGCTSPAQSYSISALWSYLGPPGEKRVCTGSLNVSYPRDFVVFLQPHSALPSVSTLVAELWSLAPSCIDNW